LQKFESEVYLANSGLDAVAASLPSLARRVPV